jgi:hypothetical protein
MLALVWRRFHPEVSLGMFGLAYGSSAACAAAAGLEDAWIVAGFAWISVSVAVAFRVLNDVELGFIARLAACACVACEGLMLLESIHRGTMTWVESGSTVLAAIAVLALVIRQRPRLLFIGTHILAMIWWYGTLEPVSVGASSFAWAAIAIAQLVVGARVSLPEFRNLGVATILVVSGKLVFFDTAHVAQIWRMLLFLGIGAAFLLVGWLLPSLSRFDPES